MIEELNLQCPYKVTLNSGTQTYFFTTKSDIEYRLAFIDFRIYFAGTTTEALITKVYSLNIDKVSDAKAVLDPDVQATIECVIIHFFEDTENSLVYVCDHSDNKHEARKFNRWFNESELKENFVKLDDVLHTPDGTHYISLMFHALNPFRKYVEKGYYEVVESLNKPD